MVEVRNRRSLRTVIALVTFGLIGLTLAVGVTGFEALLRAERQHVRDRDLAAEAQNDAARLLLAMLNQEAGFRGYIATGETDLLDTMHEGEDEERTARAAMWVALEPLHDLRARQYAVRFVETIDDWHDQITGPQIAQRAQGPLVDLGAAFAEGKDAFDRVRDAHEPLLAAIQAYSERAEVQANRIGIILRIAIAGALAIVLVIAGFAIRYLFRHSVSPIAELARTAEQHARFPEPRTEEPIREVYALAQALHGLDTTVHEREGQLASAHEDAVALTRFGEFAQQLSDEDELHDSYGKVLQTAGGADRTHVMIRNASKNRLEVLRPRIDVEEQLKHPILSEPLKCRAVRTLREVRETADAATACRCELGVPSSGSYLCLPMLAAGELVGITNLQSADRNHFTPERSARLQGYSGFAGATVSSLRLIAATRDRALRDGLSGAYNRVFLGEFLAKTIASSKRRGATFATLMIDLDHFKQINDRHGHLVGDQAIIALARVLAQESRASDAVVRYGGEEFVVLLLDVSREQALLTAERIRAAIADVKITFASQDLGKILRASIGVAMFPAHADDDRSLLAAADAALYRAKHAGRNRVEVSPDGDPASTASTTPIPVLS